MIINDAARFNTEHEHLCTCLRWKNQFYDSEHDPTVQSSNTGLFWCLNTQTCIGPDGGVAEPGNCSSPLRRCHSER